MHLRSLAKLASSLLVLGAVMEPALSAPQNAHLGGLDAGKLLGIDAGGSASGTEGIDAGGTEGIDAGGTEGIDAGDRALLTASHQH